MPGLATGGVSFWGAELGPELLHFASGSVTPIFQERPYVVPPMTYVSPAHANPGLGGGGDTHVHLHIDRAYGIEDLTAQVFEIGLPRLVNESHRRNVAIGVTA